MVGDKPTLTAEDGRASTRSPEVEACPQIRPGERIGDRYEIVSMLGSGGYGRVYAARDLLLVRDVAIKFIGRLSANEQDRARFFVEARAMARLQHENVVSVYDAGDSSWGLYIVLELLRGQSLADILKSTTLNVRDSARMIRQIASGLEAAHRLGIVHRDIKPGNIFMSDDGTAKLGDFGTAQLAGEATTGERGRPIGTPHYMSPEQIAGKAVGPGSDIFSLGCVFYKAITGQSVSPDGWQPLPAKTKAALGSLDPLRRQMLEREPAARPKSASHLAKTLESWLLKRPRRRRWSLTVALTVGIGASIIAWQSLRLWRGASLSNHGIIKSIAVLPLVNLSNDPAQDYLSDGVTEELINQFAKVKDLRVVSQTTAMLYKKSAKPLSQIARELKVDAVVEGTVLEAGERIRVNAQLIEASTDKNLWAHSYERSVDEIRTLNEDLASDIAATIASQSDTDRRSRRFVPERPVNPRAYEFYLRARHYASTSDLKNAEIYMQRAIAADADYARAHVGLADIYVLQMARESLPFLEGDREAEREAFRALALDPTSGEAHRALSSLRLMEWRFVDCEREIRQAVELEPGNAEDYVRLATYDRVTGRYADAVSALKRSCELDPISGARSQDLAAAYLENHEYDAAISEARRTLELPNLWHEHMVANEAIALALAGKGLYRESVRVIDQTLEISQMPPHMFLDLAPIYLKVGRKKDFDLCLREWARKRQNTPFDLARTYALIGDKDRAFTYLNRAVSEHAFEAVEIKEDSVFDGIRSDGRFKQLVARIGFPPE